MQRAINQILYQILNTWVFARRASRRGFLFFFFLVATAVQYESILR